MNSLYESLFDGYAAPILLEAENFDEAGLTALLDTLALDATAKLRLMDAFFDHHLAWSSDAFVIGLHLGLRLGGDLKRQ